MPTDQAMFREWKRAFPSDLRVGIYGGLTHSEWAGWGGGEGVYVCRCAAYHTQ